MVGNDIGEEEAMGGRSKISPEACNELHLLGKEYRKVFYEFTDILDNLSDGDSNLKFLRFKLDFNEYYSNER